MVFAAILAGVGLAAGAIQNAQDRENQKAISRFNQDQFLAIKDAAIVSFIEQGLQERVAVNQFKSSIAEEILDIANAATRQKGAVAVAAGAGGVGGRSVAELGQETENLKNQANARLRQTVAFREAKAELNLRARAIQTRNRILGAQPGPELGTGFGFNDLLGIGQGGLAGLKLGSTFSSASGPSVGDPQFNQGTIGPVVE